MWKYFIYEEKEEQIAVVSINRQEALNALNGDVLKELDGIIDQIEQNKELRAVILTGAGRAFAAGADIGVQSVFDYDAALEWGQTGSAIFKRWEDMDVPTIAAVNGFALGGGCELAICCDIIIAGEKAKFGQPEVSLGIIPGFSGTQRLTRKIGSFKAKELIFTGAHISAEEAKAIGLANKVVPQEDLMEEAMNMARAIGKNGPIAVKLAKKAVNCVMETTLTEGIKAENVYFAQCYETKDQKEGMQAFLEKRKATFTNQ